MITLPSPLRTDGSNAFAHHSMAIRVPGIIQEVLDRNPDYSPEIRRAFLRLHDDVVGNEPLRLISMPAPDYEEWKRCFDPYEGQTWLNTEWFLAEMLVYRLMMDAGQYWTTLRDPFGPHKREEMESQSLWEALETACMVDGSLPDRLEQLLTCSLWGNRIDLSLKQTAALGMHAADEHLIVNEIPDVVTHLLGNEPGHVHVIMDNAGTEQALDLVLVNALLSEGVARKVTLHVKMHPVLVSDATTQDTHALLVALRNRGGEIGKLASRLDSYLQSGALLIASDFFWTTPGRLWELPAELQDGFSGAALVIAKGDINYRRITNDAVWPAGASMAEAIESFPAPLLALRTLKSDTLIGVESDTIERLNRIAPRDWRTSGTYAVAQAAI